MSYQQSTKSTQENKPSTEEVTSGRPVTHSTPVPSEVLSESDDDLIYMGMDTGDSADVDTANNVIIIDEEDDQKDTKVTDMKKEDKQKPA